MVTETKQQNESEDAKREASELHALLSRNKELTEALDKAAYGLFRIKRMDVPDDVAAYASTAHEAACRVLNVTK